MKLCNRYIDDIGPYRGGDECKKPATYYFYCNYRPQYVGGREYLMAIRCCEHSTEELNCCGVNNVKVLIPDYDHNRVTKR